MEVVRKLLELVYRRLSSWLGSTSPGTLQITGVLGLAFLVVGYFQIRGGNNDNSSRRPPAPASERAADRAAQHAPSSSGSASRHSRAEGASHQPQQPSSKPAKEPALVYQPFYPQLAGVKRLTVSTPGVILSEWQAMDLQSGATLRPEAVEILGNLARSTDVYLITQVVDDVGQAVVQGCLEAAGVLGFGPGLIKPHKVLFCSTPEGKQSIVRQIEPELHIDGDARAVEGLSRFMPQLLHILPPGTQPTVKGKNLGSCASLASYLS